MNLSTRLLSLAAHNDPHKPFELIGNPQFRDDLLSAMLREAEQAKEENDHFYAESLIHAIAGRIVRLSPTHGKKIGKLPTIGDKTLRLVLSYIEENLSRPISLETLAGISNMSVFHFARTFRAAVGISPHQHLIRRRCEFARDLILTHPSLSLSAVAQTAGFSDQSHFGRHFKHIFGISPARARSEQVRSRR